MPNGRTIKYVIWRGCERFNIIPPGLRSRYEENTSWQIAQLMAYENIREYEELDVKNNSKF